MLSYELMQKVVSVMSVEFSFKDASYCELIIFSPDLHLKRIEQIASGTLLGNNNEKIYAPLSEKLHIFTASIAHLVRVDSANNAFVDVDLDSERQLRDLEYTDLLDAFNAAEELFHTAPGDTPISEFGKQIPENTLFLIEIAELRAECQQLYTHVVRTALERRKASRQDPVEALIAEAGFADENRALARMREWRSGYPRALRRPRERKALEALLPDLIDGIGQHPSPDRTLATLDLVLCRLPTTTGLFTQCQEQPGLLPDVLKIIASSPDLARLLEAYPHFLNRVIDGSVHVPLADDEQLDAEFLRLTSCRNDGRYPQLIAERVNFHRFALGVQALLAGTDLLEIAARMSDLGEAAVRVASRIALQQMRALHGAIPGCELAVLALGRFGGRELTRNSDLDLIFVHTCDHRAHSDGARSLDANEYFCRMASWVTGLLTTITPLGPLYEVDTRLRPWGGKGLLACSVAYFGRYSRENALTWENMALTRARVISGSARARAAVDAVLADQLQQFRDAEQLVADARAMRARMARHKPARDIFDVKLIEGGLVDLEFAIHVHQLRERIGFHANLGMAIRALCGQGLVSESLLDAHRVLTRLLISLRAYSTGKQEPPPALRSLIAEAGGFPDWPSLAAAYAQARLAVQAEWMKVTGLNMVPN